MAIRFSTGLKNRILNLTTGTPPGSSLGDAIDDGQLIIYSGSPPASPDDAATGTVLVTYVENATGSFNLTFEASTSGGSLVKAASQTWSGVSSASGTGGYFRYVVSGDDGTADPTQVRIQGTAAIRRALHDGHSPRPLQEKATRKSCPQSGQRARAKP
jgi:hypothetical protein